MEALRLAVVAAVGVFDRALARRAERRAVPEGWGELVRGLW